MANPEIMTQRIMVKGIIAEAGLEAEVADFKSQFEKIIASAKDVSEKEQAAAIMAITLIGLDLADESGL
ncbi:hypothetical protein JLBYU43_92 [Escherichia phage JLBYU43]|uniref:Uncharacterized protein n=1 Tax=Escherichia phage JLBYU43 TaxID=2894751 RepID=A0AAE8YYM4_9CAUD|nr:hypothetical protein JLBYU43_92 [Escherichia phage JLBYU43]